jgi:hypothetical protein
MLRFCCDYGQTFGAGTEHWDLDGMGIGVVLIWILGICLNLW